VTTAAGDAAKGERPFRSTRYKRGVRIDFFDMVPFLILIVLIATMIALNPSLASFSTLESKSNAALVTILVASGQTFVILTGGLDLSVGAVVALTNSLSATQMTEDPRNIIFWVLAIAMIGLGAGALNGLIVTIMRVTPFIATLATWSVWSGVALLVLESDGGRASGPFKEVVRGHVLGIPGSLVILIIVLAGWSVLRRTRWGVELFAVGSNEKAALLSGTSVVRAQILAYSLSGFFAAMAGLYRTVQVGSGSPVAGLTLVLPSIAAVVLGGASLSGGRGGVGSSVIGALILLFTNDVIFFMGISTFYTPMVQGLLLASAVAINVFGQRLRLRRLQA